MFRNRGPIPDLNPKGNADGYKGFRAPHYRNYWNGRFIILRVDKSFVIISMTCAFIIFIIAFFALVFGFQLPFEDPIATVKENFLTAQFTAVALTIAIPILAVIFVKSSKEHLIMILRIISVLSFVSILVFLGIKANLDNKYNESKFESFYNQYKDEDEKEDSKKVVVGLSGIKLTTSKQNYIDKSKEAYTNFTIKTVLYMVLQLILIAIIFYFSIRLTNIENKKEKLEKDDKVLFDDVQNVKY